MKNVFLSLTVLVAMALCLFTPSIGRAQTPQPKPAYIASIKGQKQGQIKGEVVQRGREQWFQLYSYRHEIISPRDSASGLPTGKRQHKPIVITRRAGTGSASFMNLLTTNENITELKIMFFQVKPGGVEESYQTVSLLNANLAGFRQFDMPGVGLMEELSFTYQKITVTSGGNIISEDEWSSRS